MEEEAEAAAAVVGVGVVPGGFVVEGRGYDTAGDHAEGGGDGDAEGCEEEDFGAAGGCWVEDVVV